MKNNKTTYIIYATIFFILSLAITLQIRTMASQDSNVSQLMRNSELKDSLLQWEEKYNMMENKLEESNKELETIRTKASNYDSDSKDISEQLKNNDMLLGLTNVSGEGIIITAKDGQAGKATDNLSDYLVHDADLRAIVSELSNAGAEAISINDERVVNPTCIICAGNVISVNGEKITSPFVIKAIGNQERLYGINMLKAYNKKGKEHEIDI